MSDNIIQTLTDASDEIALLAKLSQSKDNKFSQFERDQINGTARILITNLAYLSKIIFNHKQRTK